MKKKIGYGVLVSMLIALFLYYGLRSKFEENSWKVQIDEIGFISSPKAADLNSDGILDIVLGGAGTEFDAIQHGVIAINGKDGSLLWKVPARNQVVGTAMFKDITSDGVPDVFIGGRSAILYAIDGAKGKLIWEYLPTTDTMDLHNDIKILNFLNPQFIPDVDGDGTEDLLLPFGGYVKAEPTDTIRPSGKLMVINTNNGAVLHNFLMPDGKETYMSPLVYKFEGDEDTSILFGSGGEEISGNLYLIAMKDFLAGDTAKTKTLAYGEKKGFIAPPVLIDVNKDGIRDIVVNAVEGKMICIDGKTKKEIWSVPVDEGFHVSTMPTPGFFTGDDSIPDFYTGLSFAPWSHNKLSTHILVDGKQGKLVATDTTGVFQYASSTVFDFFKNDTDEVLVANNKYGRLPGSGFEADFYMNELKIFNFENQTFSPLRRIELGANLGSTPLIIDIDNDGWLDIINCYSHDGQNLYSFKNGVIERIELKVKTKPIRWGSYMGSQHNGVW